ncbi:MAG TPA: acyl-CoA synthetase FdrA [Rhodospirillales bacterium]|nr:acyl-CoA synthetase FdrA [Rhodospirillales bacterium]
MARLSKIFPNTYRDSVALMQVSAKINELTGITQASLIMATATNLELLQEAGLIETVPEAGNNDLLLALEGENESALQEAVVTAESKLHEMASGIIEREIRKEPLRSIEMALDAFPDANLALISCPGEYATAEALKALNLGLDVMLFSDNISEEDEIFLKKNAETEGLLMMGPDCGTAIVNGVPLGFANNVKKGSIGIVAASGTGLQQVSCLIDRWGGGISQAIGTGGRDLSTKVGGSTMIAGIDALAADSNTKVIVLISKPPSQDVAFKVLERAAKTDKPVVVNFLGSTVEVPAGAEVTEAKTLEAAAHAAVRLTGIDVQTPARHLVTTGELATLTNRLSGSQKYVRGLYSGGTFSYEAMILLTEMLGPIHSAAPLASEQKLDDPWQSREHTVLDLGGDVFTRGRPHPMIDHRLRNERILQEAMDPETAVILLDIVLGFGSHENPAEDLAVAISEARRATTTNEPIFIGFVCGTKNDPQNLEKQETMMSEVGVLLMESNAQAARLAGDMILQQNSETTII